MTYSFVLKLLYLPTKMIWQTLPEEMLPFAEEREQEEGSTGEGGGQPPLQRPVQHIHCVMHTKWDVNPPQLANVHACTGTESVTLLLCLQSL